MQLPDLYSVPSAMKIRVSDLANTWSVLTKTRNRFTVIASALFMLLLIACSAESQEVTPPSNQSPKQRSWHRQRPYPLRLPFRHRPLSPAY